jgi:pyruvate carboxylase
VWTASLPDPNALAKPLKKILVANRGEIALRVLRACNELGIRSVAVYAHEDRASIHRIKADESYLLGNSTLGPIGSYLSIDELLGVARASGVDGIHPGYGFLSESAEFARRCQQHGIKFIGPSAAVIDSIGNKTGGHPGRCLHRRPQESMRPWPRWH